jgi:hypothetical protein
VEKDQKQASILHLSVKLKMKTRDFLSVVNSALLREELWFKKGEDFPCSGEMKGKLSHRGYLYLMRERVLFLRSS